MLGASQNQDVIAGTARQYVTEDYAQKLQKTLATSTDTYKQLVSAKLKKDLGFTIDSKDFLTCEGTQNDAALNCPVNEHKD